MQDDRPVLGILLMLCFCVLAPFGDALAKLLGATLSVGVVVTVRFAAQAVLLGPLTLATGRPWRLRGRLLRLAIWRTLLLILGIGLMFTSLQFLPLAEAIAIAFVMPFIMLILGKFVLHEEIGARRLIACAVGFVGTLMVVQPSFAEVGLPALLPLGVALDFALFMLVTRQIAKETDPIALQAIGGVIACLILIPALIVGDALGLSLLDLTRPTPKEALLLLIAGAVGTLSHLAMTWSLRFAPSATLAPMQYLEIPVATFFGWVFFRDLPDGLAAVGLAITIAAGLYVIYREQAIQRRSARLKTYPPAPPAAE